MKSHSMFCMAILSALVVCSVQGADRGLKVRTVLGEDLKLPDYHALIIGINRYKHWRGLRQAREDAKNVATLQRRWPGWRYIAS